MTRLLVTGGRDYRDRAHVFATLDAIHAETPVTLLVHGAATGADGLARDWAIERGIKHFPFPADWNDIHHPEAVVKQRRDGTLYDAAAGPRRNRRMLDEGKPDMVLAFPGDKGTGNCIWEATQRGVPVRRCKAAGVKRAI